MNKNKGYMLFETLVVSTVVLGTLVFLFIQFAAVKRTYDVSFKYNTILGVYHAKELADFIKKDGYQNIMAHLEGKNYVDISNCLYSSSLCKKIKNNIGAKKIIFIGSNIEPLKNELKGTYDTTLFDESFKKYILQLSSIEAGRNRILIQFENETYSSVTLGNDNNKEYTIINLIQNSGFEDNSEAGLNKWFNYSSITDEKKYFGNYSMKYISNDEKIDEGIYQTVNLKNGHIYYASEYLYLNPVPSNQSELELNGSIDLGNISLNTLIRSRWNHVSFTFTSNVTENFKFKTAYTTNEEITIFVDNVMLIDLTETFGTGNEPTQDWCDSHISYFDGTSSIYK